MKSPRKLRPRRPNILPTIGLIVEGDSEFAALPLLHKEGLIPNCPPMKTINLHGVGSDRHPIGIAKMVTPKIIQLALAGCKNVVVCFDREQRPTCAPQLAREVNLAILNEFRSRGNVVPRFQVVVADRAFEAWLLAGAESLHAAGIFNRVPGSQCFEGELGIQGRKGTEEISSLLGRTYDKTRDGPSLFRLLNFVEARSHGSGKRGSRSFDKFLRSLGV